MIDIIFKDVIGWDKNTKMPNTTCDGIFGKVSAATMSVEEQGQRTLHAHILIWVQDLNCARNQMFCSQRPLVEAARKRIIEAIDNLCSSKCIFSGLTIHQPQRTPIISRCCGRPADSVFEM
jgi:hypothetical protein